MANDRALNPAPATFLSTVCSRFSVKDLTIGLDVTRSASVHSSVLTCANFFFLPGKQVDLFFAKITLYLFVLATDQTSC